MYCKIDYLKCVKSNWYHKWCSLYSYRLYDYVKGPLKFPMVSIPIPYTIKEKNEMDGCNCTQHLKECYSKPGIPDPWDEYLIFRREMDIGKDLSCDFPKCDLDITRYLDKNYRVYIGQGIPDPWKKLSRIDQLEPNFDDLRKNWKSYIENLRIGPGCDMYDVDKVCCPNCNRRLLVLCLKKCNKEEKEIENEVVNTNSVSKPIEEKSVKQNIYMKDACVETDRPPHATNDEDQTSKTSNCKLREMPRCSSNFESCQICNQLKDEAKTEHCRCKKNGSCCSCKKNFVKNGYFYNAGPNYPARTKNSRENNPTVDQSESPPLPKLDYGHVGSILPFFCSNSNCCGCSAQQFIGFQEKNKHGLELQLMCPKCESKRKKRRRTKCEQRNGNYFPCHCRNNERDNFRKFTNEHDIYNYTCEVPQFKRQITANTSLSAEHGCRRYCKQANKTRTFKDRDYLNLLKILGCNNFFFNDIDVDCDERNVTRNKISLKGKRPSISSSNRSPWEDNTCDINRGFRDLERDLTDRNCKQYEICRRSRGTKNEFEILEKDLRYRDKNKQIPRRIPYNSHNTVDDMRKLRSRSRRRKKINTFRKELNYFLSNCGKNVLTNDSESSSRTRAKVLNTRTKLRESYGQREGNII